MDKSQYQWILKSKDYELQKSVSCPLLPNQDISVILTNYMYGKPESTSKIMHIKEDLQSTPKWEAEANSSIIPFFEKTCTFEVAT
jgi:hypothetical protein